MAGRGNSVTAALQPHDPFTVDVVRTLEALTAEWGTAFLIDYAGGRWLAIRRDGTGGTLRGLTPDDLAVAMRAGWAGR